ncbi:hypothetical protein P3T25_003636 [Paraburkholderia sp. GAS32]
MSDLTLAILIGIIAAICGAGIWAASSNQERLTHWFKEHHLSDLIHHKH